MVRSNIRIPVRDIKKPDLTGKICHEEETLLYKKAAKLLRVNMDCIVDMNIRKKSIDARKKEDVCFTYSIDVKLNERIENSKQFGNNLAKTRGKAWIIESDEKHASELFEAKTMQDGGVPHKPVIIGAGPAGLFASYILALNGCEPILIEQGDPIGIRVKKVEDFWNNQEEPDRYSNVSFGEGGAGTFSDGKLNTMVRDSFGRIEYVKQVFAENGAPEEILYLARPHIGTDELRQVIVNIRNKIIDLGGKVCFNTRMTDIRTSGTHVTGVVIRNTHDNTENVIDCSRLILAIGHSARESYYMLRNRLHMEHKDFAIGLRIQHSQSLINRLQYGEFCDKLPPADYKLTYHSSNGRAVYSFCMCPGGYVVNASTEEGGIAINGMSNHSRSSDNANSAIVANVTSGDFDGDDVLAGVEFQRKYERKAYEAARSGGVCGAIPCERYSDYRQEICDTVSTGDRQAEHSSGSLQPITKGRFVMTSLKDVLPADVADSIVEAIDHFGNKMPGFGDDDVLLCGVETRTSSPVRIVRDDMLQSNIRGIYPCGEGAGYAGGIMSAAVDGIKCAMAVLQGKSCE